MDTLTFDPFTKTKQPQWQTEVTTLIFTKVTNVNDISKLNTNSHDRVYFFELTHIKYTFIDISHFAKDQITFQDHFKKSIQKTRKLQIVPWLFLGTVRAHI